MKTIMDFSSKSNASIHTWILFEYLLHPKSKPSLDNEQELLDFFLVNVQYYASPPGWQYAVNREGTK